MSTAANPRSPSRLWLNAAAALSAVAGTAHLLAAPAFFPVWVGYGLFFSAVVAAQFTYAVLLWNYLSLWGDHPGRAVLWPGLIGNALILGLWLATRAAGIPFYGPQAWQVPALGPLDLVALASELLAIISLASLLPRRAQSAPRSERPGQVGRLAPRA